MRTKRLTTQQRQEIFRNLVMTQDLGIMTVSESVQHIIKQYDITEAQMRQIEDEGIDKEWPPLDEAAQPVR
jgi:ribonuclease HII